MKKICFAIILICCFVCVGCSSPVYNLVIKNMSDMRINFFEGENEELYAELSCGYREQTFAYDGISTDKLECGVLGVVFKTEYSYSSICVNLTIDGTSKEYVLERSPFEYKYMVDLEKIVDNKSEVSLSLKNQSLVCSLKCVSDDWKVQYTDALKIATEHFKDDLDKVYSNGKFLAEGYLKIVSKYDYEQKFWYFSFIDRAKTTKSVLIDVATGKLFDN